MVVQTTANGLANSGPLMKAEFAAVPTETGGAISDGSYNYQQGEKVTLAAVTSSENLEITDFKSASPNACLITDCALVVTGTGTVFTWTDLKGQTLDATTVATSLIKCIGTDGYSYLV